ncbi:MAG: hypothetical protein C5B51_29815 [Terriglobia bacterium]|nr:MAG: hypothetical protein C5B51_29815 [Terriglobia bacterium]
MEIKMLMHTKFLVITFLALQAAYYARAESTAADVRAKVESKAKQLQAWGSDPQIVAAVKDYNANPPAEAKAMTNEHWKTLTLLDPFVRSFSKNSVAAYLKTKKDEQITEVFVSGADGGKVAFLSKTTWWCHRGKEKHDVPMSGKVWIGPVELDESTGRQQVQVGLPVLDGGKPIGSIVVGLSVADLK